MQGPKLFVIAWRNLWRQKRRTVLTLISIAFGGFLALIMTATQDRSFSDFIDTAARLGGGHVMVQNRSYQDTPSLAWTVKHTETIRALVAKDPDVATVVDRVMGQAMLSTSSDSYGVTFIAYDPKSETPKTLSFLRGVTKGKMFDSSHDKGIVLGKRLAANLRADLGTKIVYTMVNPEGDVVAGMGRLTGVIGTGAPSLDAALCLLPIDVVRESLGFAPDEATHVSAFLSDSRKSLAVAYRLNEQLRAGAVPEDGEDVALTWDQVQPDLKAFIGLKVGGARVMEIIIGLLVAAGIFNTLFVSVMERVREFGIQLAIGWSPFQIFRLVMWESLWLALVGLLGAGAITAWPYHHLGQTGIDMSKSFGDASEISGVGFDMVMRVGIFPENAVIIACAILLATLAAGLYPAWRACRVQPVESIKLV
jgi:ABC-type lipoprotein release transport system permease subunit